MDLVIEGRFGEPAKARECYLVLIPVITEALERIEDDSITVYRYDPSVAKLVRHGK